MSHLTENDRIKILEVKARYFRYLDTKQWDKLRTVFTDDATFDGFSSLWADMNDPNTFINQAQQHFSSEVISVHHGHMAEISLVEPNTARGIWSMEDYVTWPADGRSYRGYTLSNQWGIKGYGHYEDEFKLVNNQWLISKLRLTRIRIDPLVGTPQIQPKYELLQASPDWLTT